MRHLARLIENLRRGAATGSGLLLIGLVALFDYLTGYEISFSLFYLLPVALMSWAGGRAIGLAGAFLSTVVWLVLDKWTGHPYSNEVVVYWNAAVRCGFFVIVALLLARLRVAIEAERELSRKDALTGAWNKRFFIDLLDLEVQRFEREHRPFTLVYLDLDNFKQVNDRDGHAAGDATLKAVVSDLGRHLRRSDLVGRLGGDEFALLLPDTGPFASRQLVQKLHALLTEEMVRRGSPVRFSIGAVTCGVLPNSVEALLGVADGLMYQAKRAGKGRVVFADLPEVAITAADGSAAPSGVGAGRATAD